MAYLEDGRCVFGGLSSELAICEDVRKLWKGRRRSEGTSGKKDCCRNVLGPPSSGWQGAERLQNVPGPPSSGQAGSRRAAERARAAILRAGRRRAAERARAAILRAGREQRGCIMCWGHHPLGGQGAEKPQNVPGPPFFGWAGNRTAAERAGAAILRAGREQRGRRTCQDRHSSGGQGADVWREGGM